MTGTLGRPSARTVAATVLLCAGLTVIPSPARAQAPAPPTCQGRTATLVGTAGDDHLIGTQGSDVILGLSGDDTLEGLGAADYLCGRGGTDTLVGGTGRDRLIGDPARGKADGAPDTLDGGPGADYLETQAGDDALIGGPGADGLISLEGADHLDGGPGNDYLDGGWGHNELLGGDDDDHLQVELGPGTGHHFDGGSGRNHLQLLTRFRFNQTRQTPTGSIDLRTATFAVDWPTATSGTIVNVRSILLPPRWTVWGTDASERFAARQGPITIHAGGGNDRLGGTGFADHLDGGDGTDSAHPGRGDDACISVEKTNVPSNTCDPTGTLGPTELVPASTSDSPARKAAVSATGRYIAFQTAAPLVAGDTNGTLDIYVRDRRDDRTTRVSTTSRGLQLTKQSTAPDISADGRYVVFQSRSQAVPGLKEWGPVHIFLHDTRTGRTTLASVNSQEESANRHSRTPTISADGTRIAFTSQATNLVRPDGYNDVYVRDRSTDRTILATRRPDGTFSSGLALHPTISANGRFVLFVSFDRHLTDSDREGIFVRDLRKHTTDWIAPTAGYADWPSISGDGRYVAFVRRDPDCQGAPDSCAVVMVLDRRKGVLRTASVTPGGQRPDAGSRFPVLSRDGRHVLFTSSATNLVDGDDNLTDDVFIRDLRHGITTLVSSPPTGTSNGPSGSLGRNDPGLAMSDNGTWLIFHSAASNLVDGDDNDQADLLARSWQPAP